MGHLVRTPILEKNRDDLIIYTSELLLCKGWILFLVKEKYETATNKNMNRLGKSSQFRSSTRSQRNVGL